MKIYAFADEASANIDKQIKAMKENRLDGLEIRNVDGVNIAEISDAGILKNFAGAILYGEELLSPGYDGINELTISNAAYLSEWTGNKMVPLPFDTAEFDRLLKEKQKSPEIKVNTVKKSTDKSCGGRWQVNW